MKKEIGVMRGWIFFVEADWIDCPFSVSHTTLGFLVTEFYFKRGQTPLLAAVETIAKLIYYLIDRLSCRGLVFPNVSWLMRGDENEK